MIASLLRRGALAALCLSSLSLRAETLEALLAPTIDAEIKRAAAHPLAEPATREDLIQAADLSSGPTNPEVIAWSDALVAANPADAALRRARAKVWLQLAQGSRALRELDALDATEAQADESLLLRARVQRFLGHMSEALAAAQAGAKIEGYYGEQCAALAKEVADQSSLWQTVPNAPASNARAAFAAGECGALDVAHHRARTVLAQQVGDATARATLLKIYAALEPDTPALTVAINQRRAPHAAAHARTHPTEENVWRDAVYFAASALTAEGPNDLAFFRNLLRDATAAGQSFPGEELRLKVLSADDPAALAKIADEDFSALSEYPDVQEMLVARRLYTNVAHVALTAARAQPTNRALWATALATARTEIEADRLPGGTYRNFVAEASAAGHAFAAEEPRAQLYAAETDAELIDAVREVLPATREHPDLETTITALVSRRILRVPPDSLGFSSALSTDASPIFDERTYLPPSTQSAIHQLHAGLERVRMWIKLGAPAAALAELEQSPADVKSSASAWLLRAQLYRALGRFPEGMLAIDRARFLSGKTGTISNAETIDRVPVASLRVDLLASAQGASNHIVPLEEELARTPDDAALWGKLALAWLDDPLYCIPKALKAAARARALDPKQPDALRAEFEALRLQAQRVPDELVEVFAPLMLERIEHLPKDDWMLRLKLIRSMPYKLRALYGRKWMEELAPQAQNVPHGYHMQRLLKLYTLSTHEEIEDWIDDMGGDFVKPGNFGYPEMEYAREIDNQMNERRGWFVREPANLFQDEEIDPRNAAAEEQLLHLPRTFDERWALYEQLRLRSINEGGPALDSGEDPEAFREKLWKSGRHGPPTATREVNPACVPYYPGLTSSERKLVLRLVETMLNGYIDGAHARRAGLAFDLLQRLQIRPRALAHWREQVGEANGAGDVREYPELKRAYELLNAGNYDEVVAMLRPLLERGIENYYVYFYLATAENSRRNFAESARLFSIARHWGRYNPGLLRECNEALAVVGSNQRQRADGIRARIAYIDDFLRYLDRDMQRAADRASQAAANMEALANNHPPVTLYNVDRLQYEADRYALSATNAQARAQQISSEANELLAERARLVEELRRL